MTDFHILTGEIKTTLTDVFTAVNKWFDEPLALRDHKPESGGWSIGQVLEHIELTNHFLIILIDKGAAKALRNVQGLDLEQEKKTYIFRRDALDEVGLHKSFEWTRPEHMEPKGQKSPEEIRSGLQQQLSHCLDILDQLKNGEGILYRTTMTVNDLGKTDVYEYLYFVAQHARRHLTQMQRIKSAFP